MKLNLTCYLKKLQLVTKLQLFQRAGFRFRCNPCVCIEGRRKKEEGRRKKEEGRRKKEEGRRKKEEGRVDS
ncbi:MULTISPECIES: hypothetical protein [unclassified Microcoleus]|uniref:hypothetical protein n=1 Tax=unclassified Microcoleus TaxID=2642155 RepID=UPI001D2DEEC0|nr:MULTISPECIES: hypothetical protein [unclassified Microcoleus]MCC3475250.1 hypothetical protein [Microcoleus sp. PH2017_13_LAR_U_A]MCC3486415.1 hypothetical protein [Microcoleus sp. PH2017_14_LAR_D_A]MCC3600482.1 hypothetical protein [Microcoleus sp. PH2017_26_ELK_O_A]MCC3625516.1 hypothetical protein [Microcoleus sp. PH2017_36_ELK_O_B]